MGVSGNFGPVGQARGIGVTMLLNIVTLGFYSFYWAYKTHEEVKIHSGEGLGGVVGLVVWILISPVSAFVIPAEIGKMYQKEGAEPPINGWTGLWLIPFGIFLIPAIVWFVKVQGALNSHWASHGTAIAGTEIAAVGTLPAPT
jgi:hypothetical protein